MIKINGTKSGKLSNKFGVPQGSKLGAFLSIIYINDMPRIIKRYKIILYAGDTLIWAEGETDEQCKQHNTT